jgi:uncharacterized protein YlxP (DUF503 family)
MVVGVVVCELHLPQARSLKDKRRVVKSLVERIHRKYRISVAETDYQDLHQRAEISIAAVSQGEGELDHLFARLRDLFDLEMDAVVTFWEPQFLEAGR